MTHLNLRMDLDEHFLRIFQLGAGLKLLPSLVLLEAEVLPKKTKSIKGFFGTEKLT